MLDIDAIEARLKAQPGSTATDLGFALITEIRALRENAAEHQRAIVELAEEYNRRDAITAELRAKVAELEATNANAATFQTMTENAADRMDKDAGLVVARLGGENAELRATLATHLGAVLGEVATERQKQRRKWGDDHDDEHVFGAIRIAAAELAVDGTDAHVEHPDGGDLWGLVAKHGHTGTKPNGRRALIIATALLVAEIERKDREAARGAS